MKIDWRGYAWALAATAIATVAGLLMTPRFDLVNVAMVYLAAVVVVSLRHARGPAVAAAILCMGAFDFLFVPPVGRFTVDDPQYLVSLAIMLAVALVISGLTAAVKRRAHEQAALEVQAQNERIRSVLLASISHDLRTPLAVMAGASSTLAERGASIGAQERQALAQDIFRQARDMSDHVSKVLQMTRLETGAVTVDRDWISIGEIAGVVLARLAERLAHHRLVVEIPGALPLVRADAGLIEQVLSNLIENAARHTPRETVVRLRARPVARALEISVEDYGGGIPAGDLERVFDKFHRGTTEGPAGGMGLGLAICRAIVRLHGGRTWAENLPAGGTAFRFTLPLEEVAASLPREATA
jgi:two-component system sensor histidine kinase KdpD